MRCRPERLIRPDDNLASIGLHTGVYMTLIEALGALVIIIVVGIFTIPTKL